MMINKIFYDYYFVHVIKKGTKCYFFIALFFNTCYHFYKKFHREIMMQACEFIIMFFLMYCFELDNLTCLESIF